MIDGGTTRRRFGVVAILPPLAFAASLICVTACGRNAGREPYREVERVALPTPARDGTTSLEAAIAARRSVRTFAPRALTDAELSQLLFAAQGITGPDGLRAAPSAGACYPLTLYVVRKPVSDPGSDSRETVHRYEPAGHTLVRLGSSDDAPARPALTECVDQDAARQAPVLVFVTGNVARTEATYGDGRAEQYVFVEAGHAAQNLLLQAVASGLAAVPMGGFDPECVRRELRLPPDEDPLYALAIGAPLASPPPR